jgi:YtkA-like
MLVAGQASPRCSWKNTGKSGEKAMSISKLRRAGLVASAGVALLAAGSIARADIRDYEFQLVDQAIKAGPDKVITVRLINKTTGKAVPDAVIFATRLDMAPDGMQEMATKVSQMPGTEPGTYRFKASFSMAGGWQLSLGAKVQGETGTVESKLVIRTEK